MQRAADTPTPLHGDATRNKFNTTATQLIILDFMHEQQTGLTERSNPKGHDTMHMQEGGGLTR